MPQPFKQVLANWYLFAAGVVGSKTNQRGPREPIMFVLTMWYCAILFACLGAFSKYIVDIWGIYNSLWPQTSSFRHPANPIFHIGLLFLIISLFLANSGYRYLVKSGTPIPNPPRTFTRFLLYMALCFWPPFVLFVSSKFGGLVLQLAIHSLTAIYFYGYRPLQGKAGSSEKRRGA